MAKKALKGKQVKRNYFEYYHKEVITQSDVFFCSMLRAARITANLTQQQLAVKLCVSKSFISHTERLRPSSLSYVRYMPKFIKWLNACNVKVQFSIYAIIEEESKIKGLRKVRITEKDKQLIEGFKSVIPLED